MRIETWHTSEDKARFKCVRTDNYADVPGEIVTADEVTGECCVARPDGNGGTETKTLSFGPHGIKIIGRKR